MEERKEGEGHRSDVTGCAVTERKKNTRERRD